MKSKGATDEALAAYREARIGSEPTDFDLWAENQPALDIFLICQTQWRTNGFQRTGLDYPSVLAVIDRRIKRKKREQVFDSVRVIELGALTGFADMSKRNGEKS